ncbi:MAG: hypothetical protein A4E54_03016 [Pelotomaculum sp. PtaB.Bin117]|nr:MAG: hypothetical protein A4E54_03016 [Pelotomaculum sp. PtaB.Bin117]OPY59413.1 MAG: hypothetical protein A4E56_03207 [Pelotomaculum sp. PtaU1.Bin065]
MNPDSMATAKIVTVKMATSLGLNMDASNVNSGILAPAPPIINAIIAPKLMPFASNTVPMGIMVLKTTVEAGLAVNHSQRKLYSIQDFYNIRIILYLFTLHIHVSILDGFDKILHKKFF